MTSRDSASFPSDRAAASAGGARPERGALFVTLAACAYLTLGFPLLESLGYRYTVPGNSFLERFHPGTYVVIATLLARLLRPGGIGRLLVAAGTARPATLLAVLSLGCALLLSLNPGNTGLSYLVDTFTAPALLALLLLQLTPGMRVLGLRVAFAALLLNAAIAIGESLTHSALIGAPYSDEYFRATALLGHPLTNALITAPAILLLLGAPGPLVPRLVAVVVLLGGMLAFSGRAATLVTTMLVVLGFAIELSRVLASGRLRPQTVRLYAVLAVLVPLAVAVALLTTSLGERLWASLYYDNSASERVAVYGLFDWLPPEWLWFGASTDQIALLVAGQAGIRSIENFWIKLLLQLGLIMFVPFAGALLWYLRWLARRGGLYVGLAVLDFLVVASGDNTMSFKTTALGALTIMVLGARARDQLAAAARQARRPAPPRPAPRPGAPWAPGFPDAGRNLAVPGAAPLEPHPRRPGA